VRIQDDRGFAHLGSYRRNDPDAAVQCGLGRRMRLDNGSAIIHHFVSKSQSFMLLGAFRLKRVVLALVGLVLISLGLISCGYSSAYIRKPPSRLSTRVMVSQDVTSSFAFGGLMIVNASNDTLARASEISAGTFPGLMTLSPTRATLLTFDSGSNSVQVISTTTESNLGRIQLPGATTSMVLPATTTVAYAAVPSASLGNGFPAGAVEVLNLSNGGITATIGAQNAQTIVANPNGTQLLVFRGDTDAVSVVSPTLAVGPIDPGCDNVALSAACQVVSGFDRPVYGIFSGGNVYILNCGAECHGKQASVQTLDLSTTPPTAGPAVPVDGATFGLINGSTLYVAGNSATNNACTGQTTAALTCGRLDVIDLTSMTVTGSIVITDGTHDHMDMSVNGQLFIGSHNCTDVGDVNAPQGEVRGCLSILDTTKPGNTTVVVPPDNGDVTGLQSFTGRKVEYVVENGILRIYDTTKNVLQPTQLSIVGQVVDVKAVDFF